MLPLQVAMLCEGFGFRVSGFGIRVSDIGFRVSDSDHGDVVVEDARQPEVGDLHHQRVRVDQDVRRL